MKSKDMVKERNTVLEETKQNLEELAAVKKKLGEESRYKKWRKSCYKTGLSLTSIN